MKPLLSIQYLRGFAALMVVIYHAMRWTRPSFDIGAAGVDVFFVISGFILWTIYSARPQGALAFLDHRWRRVAPLYWIMTLGVAALAWRWPALIWDAKVDWRHLLLSLAFIQHLNADGLPFPVITAGWSLNYEAGFYLIFAVCLLAPPKRRFALLFTALLAVPAIGVWFPDQYYLGVNLMFLQFAAGVWLARARLKGQLPGRGAGWTLAAVGLVIFALLSPLNLFESLWHPIVWGAPALLVVAGLVSVENAGGLADIRILRLLGDASYSIYLSHVVVIQLLSHWRNAGQLSFAVLAVAASLIAGVGVYYGLERHLLGLLRRKSRAVLPSPAV